MAMTPSDLDEAALSFLTERHLASLTTLRRDGSPHVVAVGFTWDNESALVRVITWESSQKARNVAGQDGGRAVVCQVDRGRWLSLEGMATVTTDAERCRDAERRYAERYRRPKERADRAVIEIAVDRVLGRA